MTTIIRQVPRLALYYTTAAIKVYFFTSITSLEGSALEHDLDHVV